MPAECTPQGKPPKSPKSKVPHNSFFTPKSGVKINESDFPAFSAILLLVRSCVITKDGNSDGITRLMHRFIAFFTSIVRCNEFSKIKANTEKNNMMPIISRAFFIISPDTIYVSA